MLPKQDYATERCDPPGVIMSGEDGVPSLSSGGVGSRFVTEKEITSAKEKRDEEWKAAYQR